MAQPFLFHNIEIFSTPCSTLFLRSLHYKKPHLASEAKRVRLGGDQLFYPEIRRVLLKNNKRAISQA